MKKILITLLVLSIPSSVFASSYLDKQLREVKKTPKYNSVQKYIRNYPTMENFVADKSIQLKDPKLIKLSDATIISDNDFNKKLAKDEKIYNNEIIPALGKNMKTINIQPSDVDFYKVYRVAERIIRANNLDYINWRISIRKSDDIDASTFSGNCITINTALYDSVYNNEDALAFVIAHEMSHQILGHAQRRAELYRRLERVGIVEKTYDNDVPAKKFVNQSVGLIPRKLAANELQEQELMADSEAFMLLTRAGYTSEKAMESLNLLAGLPNLKRFLNTHPVPKDRIKNAIETVSVLNPEWVNEGRENIYNSDVLTCKKSSDRVSIVINKTDKDKKFYQPEDVEQRLTRIAYMSYLHGNMDNAVKYFDMLASSTNKYIPYLYLSYSNEYMFKSTGNDKYLKDAQNAIQKAKQLNPNDDFVKNQELNLENISDKASI